VPPGHPRACHPRRLCGWACRRNQPRLSQDSTESNDPNGGVERKIIKHGGFSIATFDYHRGILELYQTYVHAFGKKDGVPIIWDIPTITSMIGDMIEVIFP
jgi:hypothetical protein